MIASPSRTSPTIRSDFGDIRPTAEPASTIGAGLDQPAQGRRLAAAPDGARRPAALGESRHELAARAGLVREPARVADRGVHRHRDRERPAGHEVVRDRRHRVDPDRPVVATAALRLDRVRHEVLRPQALLDVREEMVLGLDEVGALAADGRGLPEAVAGEEVGRRLRGLLARALERVEGAVARRRRTRRRATWPSTTFPRSSRNSSRRPGSPPGIRPGVG